jgi:hypothetical protein
MRNLQTGEHVQCLDVLKVAFPPLPNGTAHECAIILEIWDRGALLQTSMPLPAGALISFESIGEGVPAKVISCEQDSYGYLLSVDVATTSWFPGAYTPPHLLWPV